MYLSINADAHSNTYIHTYLHVLDTQAKQHFDFVLNNEISQRLRSVRLWNVRSWLVFYFKVALTTRNDEWVLIFSSSFVTLLWIRCSLHLKTLLSQVSARKLQKKSLNPDVLSRWLRSGNFIASFLKKLSRSFRSPIHILFLIINLKWVTARVDIIFLLPLFHSSEKYKTAQNMVDFHLSASIVSKHWIRNSKILKYPFVDNPDQKQQAKFCCYNM